MQYGFTMPHHALYINVRSVSTGPQADNESYVPRLEYINV